MQLINFRILTGTLIVVIIGLGAWGGWWDSIRDELLMHSNTVVVAPRPDPPSILITRPRLIGWKDYKKSWEIEAAKIWQTNGGSQIQFETIYNGVVFSVKDKRVEFTAGWGRLERSRSELNLGGGLNAKVESGTFTTASGFINYDKEEMFCFEKVTYQEENRVINAQKMSIHFPKDEILLEGDVQFAEKKDLMKADGLLYNTKEKKYYLIHPQGILLYP